MNFSNKPILLVAEDDPDDQWLIHTAILIPSGALEDAHYCQGYAVKGYFRKPSSMAELEEIFKQLCDKYLS